jgi:hypothetical protein
MFIGLRTLTEATRPPISVPSYRSTDRDRGAGQRAAVGERAAGDDSAVTGIDGLAAEALVQDECGDQALAAGGRAIVAAEGSALAGRAAAGRGVLEIGGLDAGDAYALARAAPEGAVSVVDADDVASEGRHGCSQQDDQHAASITK